MHNKYDHDPVVAEFQGTVKGKSYGGGAVKYDPVALRSKDKAQQFADLLDTKPLPPWELNLNTHFDETVDNIKDAAEGVGWKHKIKMAF